MNNDHENDQVRLTRRQALKGTTLATAVAATAAMGVGVQAAGAASQRHPFYGSHQGGVTTPIQDHLVFAVFDVTTTSRNDLSSLLQCWTHVAAQFVEGRPLVESSNRYEPPVDTGEAVGLAASHLTLTFGVGPSLFDERFGLADQRPSSLIDLPPFPGDHLDALRTGGDLCIQACADDPLVAFHAVRNLARSGLGTVALRYLQFGAGRTSTSSTDASTPRNLLGFKDGTNNLSAESSSAMDQFVWVDQRANPRWMRGGTYLVARRIRVHLEEWSALSLQTQEQTIGRFRSSGAPLTGQHEHDVLRFGAVDHFGQLIIPANSHVRVTAPFNNDGARMLRRGFNFTDGVDPVTGELDAGLMFICFQKDPLKQFVTVQRNVSRNDSLSNYVETTGSSIFACPPGALRGSWLGQALFSSGSSS